MLTKIEKNINISRSKIALTLQYRGGAYVGYQRQKGLPSVQEEVEKGLYTILRKNICIYAAGRTDSGVHSLGQVIHFEIDTKNIEIIFNLNKFIYSLNSVLPHDISVIYGAKVPHNFHARFSCLGREYVYQVSNHSFRSAIYENYYWTHQPIDVDAVKEAIPYLLGERDFAAFTKVYYKKMGKKTIRRIDEIQIIKKEMFFFFYYRGSGFLHNMLRIITGTLLEVAHHRLQPKDIKKILNEEDRRQSKTTLPPHALFFINAIYRDYKTPKNLISFYNT